MRILSLAAVLLMVFVMCGCAEKKIVYAPVTNVSTIEPLPKSGLYRVRRDDTLYSIAWRYGLDYRYLTQINNIQRSYHIIPGQLIYLKSKQARYARLHPQSNQPVNFKPITRLASKPNSNPNANRNLNSKSSIKFGKIQNYAQNQNTFSPQFKMLEPTPPIKRVSSEKLSMRPRVEKEPTAAVRHWHLPSQGQILESYSNSNKGINFNGRIGDPIYATATGKVVYSGNGLRAYGNLIIIKHNSTFLSAYAHNKTILVHEGDWVKSGQKIAEMGDTGARRTMLHFEIRRGGKPVNPLIYLTKR